MGKGGWQRLGKACPQKHCNGELIAKALGDTHLAVECTMGDTKKRGRTEPMEKWLEQLDGWSEQ